MLPQGTCNFGMAFEQPDEAMQAWREIHAPVPEGDRYLKKKDVANGIVLLEKHGQKVMQERKKTYDLACNKTKKGEALTSLQIEDCE